MPDLELDVRKDSLRSVPASGVIDYGAVARIQRIDQRSGEISISVKVGEATRISGLDAGDYEIRVYLPSGRILMREVTLSGQGPVPLVFDAASVPVFYPPSSGAVPGHSLSRDAGGIGVAKSASRNFDGEESEENYSAQATRGEMPTVLNIRASPTLQEEPVDHDKVLEIWSALARGVLAEAKPATMLKGFLAKRQYSFESEQGRDAWHFGLEPGAFDGKRPPRSYALVQLQNSNEIVSLPLPWGFQPGSNAWEPEDYVDLMVDRTGAHEVCSRVAVRDTKYGGLVAFMNRGSLNLASELITSPTGVHDSALDMLAFKASNPLGACAAAYVLLSTTSFADAEQQSWLQWIDNLGSNPLYSWVTDAALIQARVKMLAADTQLEALAALPFLHRALRNGLPFYAIGISWLLDTLVHFRETDRLVDEVFDDVERVARYVDPTQAFLVLKYPVQA